MAKMIDYSKIAAGYEEGLRELLERNQEARMLWEIFGEQKRIIDPRYLPNREDKEFMDDCTYNDQLQKRGYSS